eukprot:scaffold1051_cov254-Pinguiococcus_pyrenoidosus.AAC.18
MSSAGFEIAQLMHTSLKIDATTDGVGAKVSTHLHFRSSTEMRMNRRQFCRANERPDASNRKSSGIFIGPIESTFRSLHWAKEQYTNAKTRLEQGRRAATIGVKLRSRPCYRFLGHPSPREVWIGPCGQGGQSTHSRQPLERDCRARYFLYEIDPAHIGCPSAREALRKRNQEREPTSATTLIYNLFSPNFSAPANGTSARTKR